MTSTRPAAVLVLAAGEGTRMRSDVPKVLHDLGGRTLLGHAVHAARGLRPEHLVVVVGHGRQAVADHLAAVAPEATVAVQETQLGTAHAVACGLAALPSAHGTVVVTYADVPLLGADTLTALLAEHERGGHATTVLSARVPDPAGYGRVLRDDSGGVSRIVEERDADDAQRRVDEINAGIYAFDAEFLRDALSRISTDNAQGEQYLTDVPALARRDGRSVGSVVTTDVWETEGVNDRVQLARMGAELNRRVTRGWMLAGVTVVDPATTWVDVTVELGRDVRLEPGVQLKGTTTVAARAVVGPDCTLVDVSVGEAASVVRTVATQAEIGAEATVGPFTLLRPGTRLGPGAKAGAYVEIKNSVVGPGSKVPHLSYVGDADIGARSNIGAATVFVNYDGTHKHRVVVGDHVRIGSDTMLVAPLTVGDGAYTAAGSVITQDVQPGALGVGRARQRNVEGWVERRRPGTPAAEAAARARSAAPSPHDQAPGDPGGPADGGPAPVGGDEERDG